MKELSVKHYIGDEIEVVVYFDHSESDPETDWNVSVTINAVLVDGDDQKDILGVLNESTLINIEQACYEKVNWLKDFSEAMEEER